MRLEGKTAVIFGAGQGPTTGGIIGNGRELDKEETILDEFSQKLNSHLVGFIPYSEKIKECSGKGLTLFQHAPDTDECKAFQNLTYSIWDNKNLSVPTSFTFKELHTWWAKASGKKH